MLIEGMGDSTLSNPTTGTGAKAKAKKKLNEMGVEVEDD